MGTMMSGGTDLDLFGNPIVIKTLKEIIDEEAEIEKKMNALFLNEGINPNPHSWSGDVKDKLLEAALEKGFELMIDEAREYATIRRQFKTIFHKDVDVSKKEDFVFFIAWMNGYSLHKNVISFNSIIVAKGEDDPEYMGMHPDSIREELMEKFGDDAIKAMNVYQKTILEGDLI